MEWTDQYGGREGQSTNLADASCSGCLILARWRVEKRKALVIANDVTSFPSIIDSGLN